MKRHITGLLLLLIFTFWALGASGAEKSMEQLVPDGSLGLISFQGLKQSIEKFKGITLVKIFQSPELSKSTSQLWETLSKGYEEFRSKFATEMGFEVTELLDIFSGKLTLALVNIDPEELNKKDSKALPEVVILAEVDAHKDRLKELLDTKILSKIKEKDPQTKSSSEEYKNISLTTLIDKDGAAVSYAFLNNIFAVALKPSLMKKVIDLQDQQGGGSIANNTSYNSVTEAVARDQSEFYAYLDMKKMLDMAKAQMSSAARPSDQQAAKFLEYYNLNSLSWSLAVENGGLKDRLFLQTYPSQKGLWTQMYKNLQGSQITSEVMIPAGVLYYQSSLINLIEFWRSVLTILQEVMPPQEYQKFEQGLVFLREGLKLDPEKNLLEHLGDEIVLALNVKGLDQLVAGGKPSPDNFPFLFMLKTKNQPGLQQTLSQLTTLLQLQFQQDMIENTPIQYLEIPTPNFPVRLNYAFINDFWVLSLSKSMLEESIQALNQKTALTDNLDYTEVKAHLPEENVIGRVYINLKEVLKLIAPLAESGLTTLTEQMKDAAPGLDQVKPPDLNQIAENLFGMMLVSTIREDGFVSESYSPVGGLSGAFLVGLGLAAAIAPPNLVQTDDEAKQAQTLSDMRLLMTTIEAYIAVKGMPPEDLESLAPEYLQEVPLRDGWGHEFIYEIGEDSQTYNLISPGKDGIEGGEGFNADIVVENGEFITGLETQD